MPRLILCWLLAAWSYVLGAPPPTGGVPTAVRVMTWNLKWFPGGAPSASIEDQEAQIKAVAGVLRAAQPDILFLQEIKSEAALAEVLDAAGLKHSIHVVSRFRESGGLLGGQQLAITSRFTAVSAWQEPWLSGWANAPRGMVYARLRIPGAGRDVNAYGLHLKSNLGSDPFLNTAKREDAAEQLLHHINRQIQETGSASVIVAGDFNTSFEQTVVPSESTLRRFRQQGFAWPFDGVPLADRITIPGGGRYPDACFDHFFLKGLGAPVARVMREAEGSDHKPVLVEVTLPN